MRFSSLNKRRLDNVEQSRPGSQSPKGGGRTERHHARASCFLFQKAPQE